MEERLNPSFDWLKKKRKKGESFYFFFRSIAAQQCSIWLKIGASSFEFLETIIIWFWSLGIHESNTVNGSWFGVGTREIWIFEAELRKGYVVTRLHTGPILFVCLGSSFGPLFGLESFWIVLAIQELLLASFDAKCWCQGEDNWLWFTTGKLWKISLGHGISFWIFPFWCILLYCMWWEVLSKLLLLDFLMENKFSWEGYFQIKFYSKLEWCFY